MAGLRVQQPVERPAPGDHAEPDAGADREVGDGVGPAPAPAAASASAAALTSVSRATGTPSASRSQGRAASRTSPAWACAGRGPSAARRGRARAGRRRRPPGRRSGAPRRRRRASARASPPGSPVGPSSKPSTSPAAVPHAQRTRVPPSSTAPRAAGRGGVVVVEGHARRPTLEGRWRRSGCWTRRRRGPGRRWSRLSSASAVAGATSPRSCATSPSGRWPPPSPRRARRGASRSATSSRASCSGEDVDLRGTVALLRDVRRLVDVRVSVWEPERERWRLLTLSEQRALWDARRARRRGQTDFATGVGSTQATLNATITTVESGAPERAWFQSGRLPRRRPSSARPATR